MTYSLTTVRAAQACPHRVKVDGPCSCFRCDGGTRDDEKVDIHQCCACIEAGGPDITKGTPVISPPTPVTRTPEPRAPGTRCSSCPVPWPHPCAGLHHPEVCTWPREKVAALTPWQHTLYQCKDMRTAAPKTTARQRDGRLRVALFGPCLMGGGAEEWQRHLLKSLDPERIAVVGVGVPDAAIDAAVGEEFRALAPLAVGPRECRALSADADIALCWGLQQLDRVLPLVDRKPTVVMVSHTAAESGWSARIHHQPKIDHFAAVSRSALAPLPPHRRDSAAVLPNAVDLDRLTPTMAEAESRAALGIPLDAPVLGFVGRPDGPTKDPQAIARALVHLPGWYGLFVGGPWHGGEAVWADCRRIAGSERAVFAGVRRDLGNVFQVMTRLMIPSLWESACLVALEGAAFGVPALMTATGVAAERPEMFAPIPMSGDGATLAGLVLTDVADPDAPARAERAKDWARTEYGLVDFGRRWTKYLCGLGTR